MANPDVTDEILESLKGMTGLQELDLNGTQVTDSGLKILKDFPLLQTLRLAKTKITDNGFHDTLFAKASLMQLDLRDTRVGRATIEAWRNARSGRRAMQ
jgi:Leucine-rich repeat (LRR) protein